MGNRIDGTLLDSKRSGPPAPEFGGRVLRVTVNTAVEPNRVVSVFFDRRMKGKL